MGIRKKNDDGEKKEIIVKTQNKTGKKLRKIEEATLTTTIYYTRTHTHRWAYAEKNAKNQKIVETKNHFADEM